MATCVFAVNATRQLAADKPDDARPRPRPPSTPAMRRACSGVCAAAASSRIAKLRRGAHSRPSITITNPTRNDEIAHRLRLGAGRRWPRAVRVGEVLEELAVGRHQHARVGRLDAVLVGLHRAVELEEVRVAACRHRRRSCCARASPSPRSRSPLRVASALMTVASRSAVARMRLAAPAPSARNSAASRWRSARMRSKMFLEFCSGRSARLMRTSTTSRPNSLPSLLTCWRDALHQVLALVAHDVLEGRAAEHAAKRRIRRSARGASARPPRSAASDRIAADRRSCSARSRRRRAASGRRRSPPAAGCRGRGCACRKYSTVSTSGYLPVEPRLAHDALWLAEAQAPSPARSGAR